MATVSTKGVPFVSISMSENASGEANSATAKKLLNIPDEQSHICPQCGDVYPTLHSLNTHHVAKHGDSIRKLWATCKNCHSRYQTTASQIDDSGSSFCSRECMSAWQEQKTGENNPNWKGGLVKIECSNCGETCERKPSVAQTRERVYCDRSCYSEHRGEWYNGEDAHNWIGGESKWECEICGEIFQEYKSQITDPNNPHCSFECARQSLNWYGQNHPNWNGGKGVTDGIRRNIGNVSWDERRRQYYENHSKECYKCGSNDNIQLHHIIPIKSGGTNGKWNLMPLCGSCHRTVESYTWNNIQEVVIKS